MYVCYLIMSWWLSSHLVPRPLIPAPLEPSRCMDGIEILKVRRQLKIINTSISLTISNILKLTASVKSQ